MTGILAGILITIVAVVLFVHQRNTKKLVEVHKAEMARLNTDYDRNRAQVDKRELGLNRYDFLKYNLQQSLIVQPDISTDV